MGLAQYKKKRRFDKTPEPQGKEKSSRGLLRFVVQKHDASHLHYDFRLEMEGVLKSWAVPKGPSLNPEDKRLAMMVEDHPYDYRNFEGVIPEGNYGGGTVIVWDEGTYEPVEGDGENRKAHEKTLLKQLHSGSMKFILHGEKLKGEYALFEMKGRGERSWILMKKKDEFATSSDVLKKNRSVQSGKTLEAVAKANGTEAKHPETGSRTDRERKIKAKPLQLLTTSSSGKALKKSSASSKKKSATRKKDSAKKKSKPVVISPEYDGKVISSAIPLNVVPMMATLVEEPFDNDKWLFEIKWDGYRAIAYVENGHAQLISRRLNSFTETYYPVTAALEETTLNAVLDGEIVAVNEKGIPNFQLLQNWQNTPAQLQFYIFDILWLDGYDITQLPLNERKKILLSQLPADHPVLRYSDHVVGKGNDFFDAAMKQGLEGIMAKNGDSTYEIGKRSRDWLKIKVNQRQEVIIAGFTRPRNTRKHFGALMLGVYEENKLVYVGHTGSGFTDKSLEEVYSKLVPLVSDDCPFEDCPRGNMPVTWVRPQLVCEIKFSEWTKGRMARHPIFMGLRVDKKPKDVRFEKAIDMATISEKTKRHPAKSTSVKRKAAAKKTSTTKKTVKQPAKKGAAGKAESKSAKRSGIKTKGVSVDIENGKNQELSLNGRILKLTNLDKLYWKKENFSKGDMINYYLKIAPFMLPYMKDRPQSLNRHPNGITGSNFYQKDMKGKVPSWIPTHKDFSESTNKTIEYMVCNNEATLIYMANLGCIEMHPWHSRTGSWQNPDWCLIDLDPDKKNSFDQVIETAIVVKKVLDSIGAAAYCKTSGSSGIHIYIPLNAKYDYDQSRQLAELVVTLVNNELPDTTSVIRNPAKRKGKIYLDFLQNRQTQTAAAPYSLRPKPGVPVSTPIDWSELKKGLTPTKFTAHNIFERLKSEGDLFRPVLGKGIDMQEVLKKLAAQMK